MKRICILITFLVTVQCQLEPLEPTKFQHNKVYALENQHAGKYLTAGGNGQYLRTGDHGMPSKDQRWRFVATKEHKTGKEGWQLVPVNGEPAQPTVWNEVYIEHGKFQFRNVTSRNCLEASSRGVEVRCVRADLFQRWYPHPLTDE